MSLHTKHIRSAITLTFIAGTLFGVVGTGLAASLGSAIFPDVARNSFYDSAIGQMYSLGVIKGYDNGKFGPDDSVTRGQLAVMLQRFRADLLKNGGIDVSSSSSSRSSTSSSSSSSSSSVKATPQGTVRFTSATYSTAESAVLKVLVVRTGGAQGSITVDYTTSDGTAVAGTDYTAKHETLTFVNNETSKSFSITVNNNPLPQGNKTFNITLSNVTNNGTISAPSTAVVTILDNQSSSNSSSVSSGASSSSSVNPAGVFNLSATTYMQNEAAGAITITVNRDGGSTGAVTVAYGTSNGTATSGSEYGSVSGILSFNAGETTKTFQIPINKNTNVTGNKVFNIIIGSPTGGATLGVTPTATVTVFDNESGTWGSGTVKFVKSTYNVSKSTGYVDVAIQRVGSAAGTTTVNYNTTPMSAAAGVDYAATSGTLTFLAGESTKLVRIPIYKTSSANSGKSFNLDLSSVSSNATLGTPSTTAITIDS